MALPIKDTPVLSGNDAKKFLEEMDENKDKRISKEEHIKIERSYKFILECDKTGFFS